MFEPSSQMAYRHISFRKIRSLRKLIEVIEQQYSHVSITILIIHLVMELVSVAFYVWTSFDTRATSVKEFHWNETLFIVEVVINIIFFLEWVFLFFEEDDKLMYSLSWLSIVNGITSVPMIILGIGALVDDSWRSGWVPMYLRVWWLRDCVVVLLDYPQVARWMVDVTREIFRFLTTLFAVMCTCIGTHQIVESTLGSYTDLYDSLYCMVVAFATIGFGDVTPKTTLGRLLMICFIVVALSYFLPLFQRLAQISRKRLYYNVYNSRNGKRPHVILAGIFTELGVDIVLRNFYGGWRKYLDLRIVFLSPVEHPPEVKLLVNLPWFKDRVVLMIGDPANEMDLKRADARNADAIFLFGDTGSSAYHTDYNLIQQSLAVNQYDPDLPQLLFLRSERHTKHVASYAASVVEGERLLHHLLGLGAAVAGAVPLIMNLLRTYEPLPMDRTLSRHWVEQYEWSLRNDIYCVEIGCVFQKCDFHRLASLFFEEDVTLMGIINDRGMVELNPLHLSSSAKKVILIAKTLQSATEVVRCVEEKYCLPSTEVASVAGPSYPFPTRSREYAACSLEGLTNRIEPLQLVEDAYDFEKHFVIIDLSMAKVRLPETEGAQEGSFTSAAADIFHVLRPIRQSYPQNDIVLLTKDTSFSVYFERYWNSLDNAIPIKHIDGCGLNLNDLRRCNLEKSAGIVIFISGDLSGGSTSGMSMLVDLSIASILPNGHSIPVVVELDSLQYLSLFPPYAQDERLRKKAELDFVYEPNYIIGNALSRHMLFPSVHRTYFMEEFIDIIDMLVCGVNEETPSIGRLSLRYSPEALNTYQDVVQYCLSLRYLPIGLHRRITDTRNSSINDQCFVLTNPPGTLLIDRESDVVFYLLPT